MRIVTCSSPATPPPQPIQPARLGRRFVSRAFTLAVGAILSLLLTLGARAETTVHAWGTYYLGSGYVPMFVPPGLSNVVSVASGAYHNLALRHDGTVVAWGSCWFPWGFQLATVPAGLSNLVAIAAGDGQSMALKKDGSVTVWNAYNVETIPSEATNVVALAPGGYTAQHNLVLRDNGSVVGWGNNIHGQATVPAGLSNATAVAAGGSHSLALLADGKVLAWGYNDDGQTNVPVGLSTVVTLAAGKVVANLALKEDGTIVPWGSIYNGVFYAPMYVPGGLGEAVAVSVGNYHAMALQANGDVVAWGLYYNGADYVPMGVPAGLGNVVAISSGGNHAVALSGAMAPFINSPLLDRTVVVGAATVFRVKAAGTRPFFYQWQKHGDDLPGATNSVLELNKVSLGETGDYSVVVSNSVGVTISASARLTVVPLTITAQPQDQTAIIGGSVQFNVACQSVLPVSYQWRFGAVDLSGETNSILNLTNVQAGQAGSYSVVISNNAGNIVSSNALLTTVPFIITTNPASQAVVVSNPAAFAVTCESFLPLTYQWRLNGIELPGATNNPLVITSVGWGDRGDYSISISNSAGARTSSNALLRLSRRATTVSSWGLSNAFTLPPVGFTNMAVLAAGRNHAVAMWDDGSLGAWGENDYGQATVPASASNVLTVAAGIDHSLALRPDRTVVAWGRNNYGQTSVPAGLSNVIALAAGASHSMALLLDGTVTVWGANHSGQTNVPLGLHGVVAIAAGTNHCLALRSNGTVIAWGGNDLGQTNVPAGLSNVVAVVAGVGHSLALKENGSVVAWGSFNGGRSWVPATVPASLNHALAIASGSLHGLALRSDGQVTAWGWNGNGQTNAPAGLSNAVAVAAGGLRSLALIGEGFPGEKAAIAKPTYGASGFSLEIPTRCGHVYRLEYKNSLEDATWVALPLVPGDGTTRVLLDSSFAGQRFYRVREW